MSFGSKGSTPSGNTTTTQTSTNPTATAQLPYLQQLWGGATGLANQANQAGTPSSNNLYNLQTYAGNQGWNAAPLAGNVMPAALQQYLNQINQGTPAAAQAGQLTANAGQAVNQGLGFSQGLAGAANTALGQVPDWQNRFLNAGQTANQTLQGYGGAATGALTGLAPGALGGMSSLAGRAATAGNPAEAGLYANAGQAIGGNPALASGLQGLASGQYIDPSTNPAYAGMIQSATQPLVNQYQTAVAPQVASQFEGAGRYGSGAQTNAQGQAQYGLGQALGTAVSGITNNAYNTGLQATIGAGQAEGNIYNQGVSNITNALGTSGQLAQTGAQNAGQLLNQGYTTAGNLLNQGYTTGGNLATQGFNALNSFMGNAAGQGLGYLNAGLTGLQAGGNAAQAGYGTANTALTGGGQLLNQGSDALSRVLSQAPGFAGYPEQQYQAAYSAPWLPYNNLAGILSGAIPGTGTQTTSQPYYNNTGANILGGLTGGLGIANTIGGAQGIFPGAIKAGLTALGGSDRRIKRDIKRIGTLRNGLPLYSFRYVGSKRRQIGLMADEVEKVHPEAVIAVGAYRIKMVDYARAVQ